MYLSMSSEVTGIWQVGAQCESVPPPFTSLHTRATGQVNHMVQFFLKHWELAPLGLLLITPPNAPTLKNGS